MPLALLLVFVGLVARHVYLHAFNDQGYAPAQPIAFSHKLHAGDLGIDCRHCHSDVDRGKHAGVPSLNLCMGCHTNIATDRPEIQKMAQVHAAGEYHADATGRILDPSQAALAESRRVGGAIHWNRVHKLPDHVYFNHQQHTKAGVDCMSCHGDVKGMVVLRQHSDLSMGWCLSCHRGNDHVSVLPESATAGLAAADAFKVGTAGYATIRARADGERNRVATFAHGSATRAADAGLASDLRRLLEAVPEYRALPPGKVVDLPPHLLPESHRAFYTDASDYHNAPTQCSTCHQ